MIFQQINMNNLNVPHYKIKNKKCYFLYHNNEIHFPYKLHDYPDYYVFDDKLFLERESTTSIDEDAEQLILQSLLDFKVIGDKLFIQE